jgi:cytochrome c-type biogenesis protein CcmH/NrfG
MTRAFEMSENRRDLTPPLSLELRQACLDDAWASYQKQDYQLCEALSRALVAADTANGRYRALLAAALFRQGRGNEALGEIDDFLANQPDDRDLLELRGVLAGN